MGPVTGPFYDETYVDGLYQSGYSFRQKKPYNLPLQYNHVRANAWREEAPVQGGGYVGPSGPVGTAAWGLCAGNFYPEASPEASREHDVAYAKAYDSFMRKAKSSASLAVSLAEGKQSISMIAQRASQLLQAANAARKGDLRTLAKIFGGKPKGSSKQRRRDVRGAAGVWLEYTFGWAPLIQDIGNCVEVLQQDFKVLPFRGRGTSVFEETTDRVVWYTREIREKLLVTKVEVRGEIRVTNPDLLLANQLGFVNPLTVAWELVPFSFVVDWFLPVGKFVSSLTDTVGMEVINSSATSKRSSTCTDVNLYGSGDVLRLRSNASCINRITGGLTVPSLTSRSRFPTADAWLAGTSLSLLVQQLRSFR